MTTDMSTHRNHIRETVDAVLWDYDGTLVDGRIVDERAVAELIRRNPAATSGVPIFWATEGQPIMERLELAWPDQVDELLPLFSRPVTPTVFAGVKPVLHQLHEYGYLLGVVSSRRRRALEWGLQTSGLWPLF